MASKKPTDPIVAVERDGITVKVDMSYAKTWEGVHHMKRMRDTSLPETDRFFEMVDYYDKVVVNADEVAKALGDVDVDVVYEFMGAAVKEATPKN